MTVIEMVSAYLTANGYDGLYDYHGVCSCELGDLAPCGQLGEKCTAGYRYVCNDAECEYTADAGEHWHMRSTK